MKKTIITAFVGFLMVTATPLQSAAAIPENTTIAIAGEKADAHSAENTADAKQAQTILLRLNEIKAMDKSNLSTSEKKDLRKEVRTMRTQLKMNNGGIYLSVGAIIIIILLLILLL